MIKVILFVLGLTALLHGQRLLAAEYLSDHEEFCQTEPAPPCLQLLQRQLADVTPQSVQWFKLTSYQLDYQYDKHQLAALLQQTEQLLQQPALPPVFRTQLYFNHAKMLKFFGRMTQARHYADLAYQQ